MRGDKGAMVLPGAVIALVMLALAALAPDLALAAEAGEAHAKSLFDIVAMEGFKFLNLLIVIVLLYKLAAKPLRRFLEERREGIRKILGESEKARKEAERLLEEQRNKVADLEAELGRVREMGQAEREELRRRLDADREAQAERLLAQARNTIDLESVRARTELQNEAARLALELAEEMLKKGLGPEDQTRFAEEYLARLGERNGGSL